MPRVARGSRKRYVRIRRASGSAKVAMRWIECGVGRVLAHLYRGCDGRVLRARKRGSSCMIWGASIKLGPKY